MQVNPYESASDDPGMESSQNQAPPVALMEFTDDAKENLGLTSRVVKITACISALASLAPIMQLWALFKLYGLPEGWTATHTVTCLRLVFTPCLLLATWMLWRYANSLNRLRDNGIADTEHNIERLTKVWLSIGLLLFVQLLALAAAFGLSMSMARQY